jgi:predicted dehydrogenase
MLQVGIVGIGFMGMIHFRAYQRVPGIRVAAICTRDKKKLAGDWRAIKGNFGAPGARFDLSGVRTYERLADMLADAKLDLIDICLPASLHAAAAIAAFKAGKHVFCEKPIALSPVDAKKMLHAAAAAKKQLLIGHIVPFFPEYAFALAAAESGKYGKLLGGHFKRVIADPYWIADYYDPRRIGGPLLDLHIHDAHFIRLLFGMPTAVSSRGRMRGEAIEYIQSQFSFPDASLVVSAAGGTIAQQGRRFNQAFELHFEQATLAYDFAVLDEKPYQAMPLTILGPKGSVQRPKLGSPDPADGFVAEIRQVARSIKTGKPSPGLSGQTAADALLICSKEAQSLKSGRPVPLRD